jgi:hypothetical protein
MEEPELEKFWKDLEEKIGANSINQVIWKPARWKASLNNQICEAWGLKSIPEEIVTVTQLYLGTKDCLEYAGYINNQRKDLMNDVDSITRWLDISKVEFI